MEVGGSYKDLVGIAGMALAYLNAKHRISTDLHIVPHFFHKVASHLLNVYRGRVNYWYAFESCAFKHKNNYLLKYLKRIPGKTGDLEFEIEKYTYEEFYLIVLRLSYILVHEFGITSNDTVVLDFTNKPLLLFYWFALWNIGAIPSFLNYNIVQEPLVHSIKIVDARHVFVDPDAAQPIRDTLPRIRNELPDVELHFIDEDYLMNVLNNPRSPKYRAPDSTRRPEDPDWATGVLVYTSGTTGLPKSAIISWRKIFLASAIFGHINHIEHNSTVFTAMPLYHSTLAMLGVLPGFAKGGCVAISHNFSASTFWTQVKLTESTHMQYVGEVCRYLLNSPVHPDEKNHKLICAYGNGLRRDIWQEFKTRFNIHAIGEFYASTESPIATTTYQVGEYGIGACRSYGTFINKVLSLQQCIVKMDPEDDSVIWRDPKTGFLRETDPDEPGELLMRIFNPKKIEMSFQGYLNNKKETSSKVVRDVFRKGDAFYRSGDLIKADADGLWYFVDRLGDTFRWKSENVSTTEVENLLMELTEILKCCVVGVKVPNHEGRCGFAVIELKDAQNQLTFLEKLSTHVEQNLPSYARPYFVKFSPVETNSTHKIPKKQFRNVKLPKGENDDELIYWLNPATKKYEELDEIKWLSITEGRAKL